jgi:hypothetical protein
LDAASTTAPLNDVPNRAAVAREVRADRIRVSPALNAAARVVELAVAVIVRAVLGRAADADDVGATARRRAPTAATPMAERVECMVGDLRIWGPLVAVF